MSDERAASHPGHVNPYINLSHLVTENRIRSERGDGSPAQKARATPRADGRAHAPRRQVTVAGTSTEPKSACLLTTRARDFFEFPVEPNRARNDTENGQKVAITHPFQDSDKSQR